MRSQIIWLNSHTFRLSTAFFAFRLSFGGKRARTIRSSALIHKFCNSGCDGRPRRQVIARTINIVPPGSAAVVTKPSGHQIATIAHGTQIEFHMLKIGYKIIEALSKGLKNPNNQIRRFISYFSGDHGLGAA